MKKLIILLTTIFLLFSISGCAGEALARPETNLEFWIAENADGVDLSKYEQKPGMLGGTQFYGTGYIPGKDENGNNVDPAQCVIYTVTCYPDYSDKNLHITAIEITDPNVHFYGLSLDSAFAEFESVMKENGFSVTQESNERFYAQKGKYTIRFTGDSILIRTDVTNKKNLIF